MKKIFLPLLLASSAVWFAGCQSPGPYQPLDTVRTSYAHQSKFLLLDKGAQRSVTASSIQKSFHEDGRLQVIANIANRENRRIEVQVNCQFKDEQGFALDSTPFQTLILDEYAQESVKFVSLNDQAKDFTIYVRQAR